MYWQSASWIPVMEHGRMFRAPVERREWKQRRECWGVRWLLPVPPNMKSFQNRDIGSVTKMAKFDSTSTVEIFHPIGPWSMSTASRWDEQKVLASWPVCKQTQKLSLFRSTLSRSGYDYQWSINPREQSIDWQYITWPVSTDQLSEVSSRLTRSFSLAVPQDAFIIAILLIPRQSGRWC